MMEKIESHNTFIGLLCFLVHKPKGGYGYAMYIPSEIKELNLQGDKAVIQITTKSGRKIRKAVDVSSLVYRHNYPYGLAKEVE